MTEPWKGSIGSVAVSRLSEGEMRVAQKVAEYVAVLSLERQLEALEFVKALASRGEGVEVEVEDREFFAVALRE